MRRASSIFPRSSRFKKMFNAGGQVPVQTVAPASASALAMAKPYPPSSATPATRARLPRRSMLSIHPPQTRNAAVGTRNSRGCSAFRVPTSALHEKPRRHRNELRMFHQRVREDPAERAPLLGNGVHRPRQRVEELVVQILKRPLDAVVLERSEEHTSELQSLTNLVCRLLLEKKK